jgi:hypothetical protein
MTIARITPWLSLVLMLLLGVVRADAQVTLGSKRFTVSMGGPGTIAPVAIKFGANCQVNSFEVSCLHEVFASRQYSLADVGQTFYSTAATDPDFGPVVALLTNGTIDSVAFSVRAAGIGAQPGPGYANGPSAEQIFFSISPPRVDFKGFAVTRLGLRIDALSQTIQQTPLPNTLMTTFDVTLIVEGDTAPPRSCTSLSLATDSSLSNNVLSTAVSGSACEAVVGITNEKNFWTNLVISTVGAVTVEPAAGSANLYARHNVLPPSGFLNLPGADAQVEFIVRATGPGSVAFFADPTIESGLTAANLNVLQAVLNVLPGGNAPTLFIQSYQQVAQALAQMPHLQNFILALFSSPPKVGRASRELIKFATNADELKQMQDLVWDLYGIPVNLIKTALNWPFRVINSLVTIFGNIRTAFFQYPAGSVTLDVR